MSVGSQNAQTRWSVKPKPSRIVPVVGGMAGRADSRGAWHRSGKLAPGVSDSLQRLRRPSPRLPGPPLRLSRVARFRAVITRDTRGSVASAGR
ncbi:hypothetical protein SKAU_G00391320 [Synaphobranchus kaupii]|uniref:Uncharacterized protein n=1 Tax=Synaphobranchus kaupii TaxID=118154 RepID=A0A9Q1ICT6_SYNKA|nr:hypothetical protein SKAU_G00391320 [Synaphobranchus kaupii]